MASNQPTAEDIQKATAVSQAGAEAAAAAETPEQAEENAREAMKTKRDEVGLKMSDEDIEKIAKRFVALAIGEIEERGGFEKPPERVEAAQPETVAPNPRDPAPGENPPAPQVPQAPQRQTFAQRFMGV